MAAMAPTEPQLIEGTLASVMNPEGVVVRRKKEPSSMQLRKNGILPFQSAVWCHETEVVDGVERVHIKHPCTGWINKDEIIVGQIAIINSLVGATVREDIEIDSPVVAELQYESRVFITEQDETKDGKPRACVFAPVQGCVLPASAFASRRLSRKVPSRGAFRDESPRSSLVPSFRVVEDEDHTTCYTLSDGRPSPADR